MQELDCCPFPKIVQWPFLETQRTYNDFEVCTSSVFKCAVFDINYVAGDNASLKLNFTKQYLCGVGYNSSTTVTFPKWELSKYAPTTKLLFGVRKPGSWLKCSKYIYNYYFIGTNQGELQMIPIEQIHVYCLYHIKFYA